MLSVVVPVYGNEDSIDELVDRLERVSATLDGGLEAVFVIDGSPDDSGPKLRARLAASALRARLLWHSRNFGSFAAIRTGIANTSGDNVAVMAADLQEPESLLYEFADALASGDYDVAIGTRRSRDDGWSTTMASRLFWGLYRRFVQRDIPKGGADVFACTRQVADEVARMPEANTSLIGLLFWVGYRRALVPFDRLPRESGKSGWSLRRRYRYLLDSLFSFTDLPITLVLAVGVFGILASIVLGIGVVVSRALGVIDVQGYTPLMLTILALGSLNLFAVGVVGSYVWRAYENSKGRPLAVTRLSERFGPE